MLSTTAHKPDTRLRRRAALPTVLTALLAAIALGDFAAPASARPGHEASPLMHCFHPYMHTRVPCPHWR